jgi:hypothetical protein
MSAMEYSTASQTKTNAAETKKVKAHGDFHFEQTTVPGLVGPDFLIPASVSKFFRKLFRRAHTSTGT